MCLTIDDLFPLYPRISPVSQTDRAIACVVWVAGRVWQYTIRFYLFFCFVSLCHGASSSTFQFSFRIFGEWNIIYMFLSFSVFIYFYHFQISAVKMTKKKKGIFSYIRDCNVSFEEFLFISKFYSCCIVFYVCCSLLERNKILSIFRNFDFFR